MPPHGVLWALLHGFKCWSELHFYYADHSLGAWREWLCRK